jgi:hypothetical protein
VAVDVDGTEGASAQGAQGLSGGSVGSLGKFWNAGAARHLPHIETGAAL